MKVKKAVPGELVGENKIIALESSLGAAQREIARLKKELGKQELMGETILAAIESYPPPTPQKILIPKHGVDRQLSEAVFHNGDEHVGDYVTEERTDNWGKYDFDIARHRMNTYVDRCIRWVTDCRSAGWNIRNGTLLKTGDYVAGIIHQELIAEAEFPLPVQEIRAGQLNAEMVLRLAPHFDKFDVYLLPGNHDRLTSKKQYKGRMENSAAYVISEYMKVACKNLENVTIETVLSSPKLIHINGHGFLVQHGDNTKAWMGMPWYGIDRAEGRESKRRMQMMIEQQRNVGYEYIAGGHWHVPSDHNNWLFTGSLRGTDEYDHEAGRYAAPCWLSYLVHAKRGVFNTMKWRVDR